VDLAGSGTVYASGGDPAQLLRSSDGGATWTALPWESRFGLPTSLALDRQQPGCLYAGLLPLAAGQSCDGGATWTWLRAGLEAAVAVRQVVVDPDAAGTLYVAAELLWPYSGGP
jgi:photosystem II stability/assembly factor-like uncharacterized protein